MKIHRFITRIHRLDVGQRLVDELVAIAPEGLRFGGEFHFDCEEGDPRLAALVDKITRAGLIPVPMSYYGAGFIEGKHYITGQTAHYELVDFDVARYISVRPSFSPRLDEENDSTPDPPVRLLLEGKAIRGVSFASTNFDHLLATSVGRESLERMAVVGALFAPAYLVHPDTHDIDRLRELIEAGSTPGLGEPPLWEIRPTVVLPPMLPMKYKHFVNGKERMSRNPIDVDRRLAYAKAALDSVGPFDFAHPAPAEEKTKSLVEPYIVSQRVFQLMKMQKNFDISHWTPVREE